MINTKRNAVITSILILCPLFIMLFAQPDFAHEGKGILSFVLPCFWFAINMLVVLGAKKENENAKLVNMTMWLLAFVSIMLNVVLYKTSFTGDLSIDALFPLISGFVFILIGNYLPKINPTKEKMSPIAVIAPWLYVTINKDKDYSLRANRFAAKVWLLGGIGLVFTVLCQNISFLFIDATIILTMFIAPIVYALFDVKKAHNVQEVEK